MKINTARPMPLPGTLSGDLMFRVKGKGNRVRICYRKIDLEANTATLSFFCSKRFLGGELDKLLKVFGKGIELQATLIFQDDRKERLDLLSPGNLKTILAAKDIDFLQLEIEHIWGKQEVHVDYSGKNYGLVSVFFSNRKSQENITRYLKGYVEGREIVESFKQPGNELNITPDLLRQLKEMHESMKRFEELL